MPRRKKIVISAKDTAIYHIIVEELAENPLLADYDMESIEISIKKQQSPQIKDVAKAIANLERYVAVNRQLIKVVNGEQIIVKKDLARMLGITRLTLDKWVKNGLIQQGYS